MTLSPCVKKKIPMPISLWEGRWPEVKFNHKLLFKKIKKKKKRKLDSSMMEKRRQNDNILINYRYCFKVICTIIINNIQIISSFKKKIKIISME